MKVSMIGLGYIGLPTAAVLASKNIDIIGIDVKADVVNTINRGEIHIVEPALEAMVTDAVKCGKLRASLKPETADIFMIAVPTPFKNNHEPDISYVEAAALSIAPVLEKGNIVLLESTSPVGTTEMLAKLLAEKRKDLSFPGCNNSTQELPDIAIAYCPERVLPGNIIHELVNNDRVIGGLTPSCTQKAAEFYKLFVQGKCLLTDARTAEMCKLTENTFRDVNIAFANELSIIADHLHINVWELINLANHHPRVNILKPGPGVGGHCIAVDPWFIVHSSPEQAKLIRMARETNDNKPKYVINQIKEIVRRINKNIEDISIATLGLAFKANIDDLRESPAVEIAKMITDMGFKYHYIAEPNISTLPKILIHKQNLLEQAESAINKAEIVVLLVDHDEFLKIDKAVLTGKYVVDTRGAWNDIYR